jgi:hypothetical protein
MVIFAEFDVFSLIVISQFFIATEEGFLRQPSIFIGWMMYNFVLVSLSFHVPCFCSWKLRFTLVFVYEVLFRLLNSARLALLCVCVNDFFFVVYGRPYLSVPCIRCWWEVSFNSPLSVILSPAPWSKYRGRLAPWNVISFLFLSGTLTPIVSMAQRKRRTASSSLLYLLSVDSCEREPQNGEHSPSLISRVMIRIYLRLPTGSLLIGVFSSLLYCRLTTAGQLFLLLSRLSLDLTGLPQRFLGFDWMLRVFLSSIWHLSSHLHACTDGERTYG